MIIIIKKKFGFHNFAEHRLRTTVLKANCVFAEEKCANELWLDISLQSWTVIDFCNQLLNTNVWK